MRVMRVQPAPRAVHDDANNATPTSSTTASTYSAPRRARASAAGRSRPPTSRPAPRRGSRAGCRRGPGSGPPPRTGVTKPTATSAITIPNRDRSMRPDQELPEAGGKLEHQSLWSSGSGAAGRERRGTGRLVAQQEEVEHLAARSAPRPGRRSAVLDQHRNGDARAVGGRVGHEPGVVAQAARRSCSRRTSRP